MQFGRWKGTESNRAQIGKLARYFHVGPGAFAFTG
jgi:hypothetical protein